MRPAQKPSLVLPPTSMSYAQMVFKSVPLSKAQFEELICNHVCLSPEHYKELMANITLEKIIDSKNLGGGLKDIMNIMMANLKNRRQAEIPLLLLVDKTDTAIRSQGYRDLRWTLIPRRFSYCDAPGPRPCEGPPGLFWS